MGQIKHGGIPTWYDKDCKFEEAFHKNSPNEKATNRLIEKYLRKYKAKSILDLTCGTGSQVLWLLDRGFKVVGSDISRGMLSIAKKKAKYHNKSVKLLHGDMRNHKVGKFDAVITIFNAIGHLSKKDFAKTIRNIYSNLNEKGIYIFDILNLDYVKYKDNILKMSLEQIKTQGTNKIREIQHSILDDQAILISYTTFYTQKNNGKIKPSNNIITLQLYTANDLKLLLQQNGFKVLAQIGMDDKKFSTFKTERILTIAQKI